MEHNKIMEGCSRWVKGLFVVSLLCGAFVASGSLAFEPEDAGDGVSAQITTININTADAETLADMLDGVGASKAQAIVAWREQHGSFSSVEELAEVKGIGQAILEKNRDKLSL